MGIKIAHLTSGQKRISCILSDIIKNKINADKRRYKNTLKVRRTYVNNWLALKAVMGKETLNSLLAKVDKYIALGKY